MSTTFKSAKLDWGKRDSGEGARRLALVRELLACRAREIVPRLSGATFGEARARDDGLLTAHWRMGDGATLRLTANLSENEIAGAPAQAGSAIWGSEAVDRLPPWSAFWRIGA
jgi:maltooligosyltrehalose trehalohydrolase